MLQKLFLPGVCLSMGSLGTIAQAQETTAVLEPSGAWALDYSADKCRAARLFGEGENKTVLFLEQHNPSSSFKWLVAGPYVDRLRAGDPLAIRFGSSREPFEVTYDGYELGRFGKAVTSDGIALPAEGAPPIEPGNELDPDEGRTIEWVDVKRGDMPATRLATGSLAPVYAAMNKCMDDLVRHWGLDPEQQKRRTSGPDPKNMDKVARKIIGHFPSRPVRMMQQADLHLRVMVDAEGKPTQCIVSDITSADNFDDYACKVMMREAKFDPARDADGRPMPSYYTTKVLYRIG